MSLMKTVVVGICLNPSSNIPFPFLFPISFSFSSLKLIPLLSDKKSLMKPDTFDSIMLHHTHTDSYSQNQ